MFRTQFPSNWLYLNKVSIYPQKKSKHRCQRQPKSRQMPYHVLNVLGLSTIVLRAAHQLLPITVVKVESSASVIAACSSEVIAVQLDCSCEARGCSEHDVLFIS